MAESGEVTIWHEVLKREQTTATQDVIRIEAGRTLAIKYDPNVDTVNSYPFDIVLQFGHTVLPTLAIGAMVSLLAF